MFINSRLNRFLLEGDDGGGSGLDGGTDDSGTDGGATGSSGKVFTQQEMSARAAQEKAEGKRSAEKAIAEQLGVTVEEAKRIIDDARERDEAQKSEAQKATEAANAREAAAAEKETAAAKRVHDADVRDALRDAGVKRERVAKVASMLDVEVGADEATIAKSVDELKKEFPELFGVETGGAPHSDPGKGPKDKPAGESAMQRGAERFKSSGNTESGYPILEESKS